MAKYSTEIQWGGFGAEWHPDEPLEIVIVNRKGVVPANGRPSTGTTVSWSGDQGSADITFYDGGSSFNGNARFPGEGPVGYRGRAQ
jgi:hypothetical protein